MAQDKFIADGTFSWYGGMDGSRSAYQIDPEQYVKGINVSITTVGDNLQPRPGWHWQTLKFGSPLEQNRFETGHVQGGGWYFDGQRDCLVVVVSGIIYYFQETRPSYWSVKTLNLGNPMNPNRTKVWTCRIPGDRIIVSDGQSRPYVLGLGGSIYRPDPAKNELYPCRAMVFIQNRLWWVNEQASAIYGSDINNPLSIQNALDTNIVGIVPPDPRDRITAVGQQRYINFDQNGGELIYSTENNVYAIDVRGDFQDWSNFGGPGFSRVVLPNVGATSAFSFTSYNTNLFFRTKTLGVVNYKQLQAQWANNDELISNSIEVDGWFKKDTEWMLDQCWTVNYKGRLLTTTQPALRNGYVYWKGLISMNPAPYYGSRNRLPRRFEGLWTGVQPWCLLHQQNIIEKLFTVSADADGKNRLYHMVDDEHYDIGPGDKRVEIESIIETRAYAFGSPDLMKIAMNRFYTLDRIETNVDVKAYSRSSLSGEWYPFYELTHNIARCCTAPPNCFPFNTAEPESRREWYLPDEQEAVCNGADTSNRASVTFPYRSYRLELRGIFEMSSFGVYAKQEAEDTTITCCETDIRYATTPICRFKDFQYSIVPYVAPTITAVQQTSAPSASCGCS